MIHSTGSQTDIDRTKSIATVMLEMLPRVKFSEGCGFNKLNHSSSNKRAAGNLAKRIK